MYDFLEHQVVDAMTWPITIGPHASLAEADALFAQHDFNSLPVTRDGALVGMLTKLDLLKAFVLDPHALRPHYEEIMRQPVETVMTRQPVTVAPDMNLIRVLQTMVETRCHSLPVMIGALLIGIVAREDVLRVLRAVTRERPRSRGEGEPDGRSHLYS